MPKGRIAIIDGSLIEDLEGFHDAVTQTFGFPDWYGRNWDALNDLLRFLDDDRETTAFFVEPGETVTIRIEHASLMRERAPEIFDGLVRSCGFVNWGRLERGMAPYLCLAFAE